MKVAFEMIMLNNGIQIYCSTKLRVIQKPETSDENLRIDPKLTTYFSKKILNFYLIAMKLGHYYYF